MPFDPEDAGQLKRLRAACISIVAPLHSRQIATSGAASRRPGVHSHRVVRSQNEESVHGHASVNCAAPLSTRRVFQGVSEHYAPSIPGEAVSRRALACVTSI